ncbi:alpha/beta hydrolase [Spirillospora sp. NPDC047418]
MRTDIEFRADDGTALRGWFFEPETGTGPHPTIVMAHGITGVKELIEHVAEAFCDAGFAVLLYDHRCWGSSDGLPRRDVDPLLQVRDMRTAITFAETLTAVDATRIGLWGTSFAGAHVLQVSATDRRVRCVVSQVPMISGHRNFAALLSADAFPVLQEQLAAERRARFAGAEPVTIPVSSEDPAQPHALPGARTHWYLNNSPNAGRSPDWSNEITLRSLDWALEYDVTPFVERISPTPLLMIVAANDTLTPTAIALEAFENAHQPKLLELVPGDHYSPYHDEFDRASTAATRFFTANL